MVESIGGKVDELGALPDGSGFATASFPLPADHWLYRPPETGYEEPPAPLRMGSGEMVSLGWSDGRHTPMLTREHVAEYIRAAGRYAVRAATSNGKIDDWDPDAVIQNLVVGLLGYWTSDGLSHVVGSAEQPPSYGPGRCEICGWPLATDRNHGCVPGDCSYRPTQGSEEWRRIKARRAELAAKDKGNA